MLSALVHFSLRHAYAVTIALCLALGFSAYSLRDASFDVFPEFAPPEVLVQTEAPGFSSEQVETLITQVVESALGGTKGVTAIRSTSIQGLSAVQVIFDLKSDILIDRQLIGERLANLSSSLPPGVAPPMMAPLSSTTNNVLGIGLTSEVLSPTQLRTVADWLVKPHLLSVAGVADAEAYGGRIRQIQVQVKPELMVQYGLSFAEIAAAAGQATGVRGAGVIDTDKQRITLNTSTDTTTLKTLAETPLTRGTGESLDLSISLGDVATIAEGYQTPFSAASIMGKPGVLLMLTSQHGANTLEVTRRLEEALAELAPALQKKHVTAWTDLIRPANFIETALQNVTHSLLLGAALVVIVLLLFLRNWRAALISALAIPFSLAIAAALLNAFGWTLNTMTLGGLAIAVGLVVDDAVIDVENTLRRLKLNPAATDRAARHTLLFNASLEVRIPVMFASLAVVLIAIPIMTMPGLGGRFFAPLGVAYALAALVSLGVALTLTPALCMMFLHRGHAGSSATAQRLQHAYLHLLTYVDDRMRLLYGVLAACFVFCVFTIATCKSEFIPELHEGHFIVHMEMQAGSSLDASIAQGNQVTAALLKLPYIHRVVQQVGRTEGGIDIWGTHISEFNVALKPGSSINEEAAKEAIQKQLEQFSGANFEVSTFLTERVEEVIAGYTSDAALNVYGTNLSQLDTISHALATRIATIKRVRNVMRPSQEAIPQLTITLDHLALKKWALEPTAVLDTIHTAYESDVVGQIYTADHPVALVVMIEPGHREDIAQLANLPIHTPSGEYVMLSDIAKIGEEEGRYAVLHDGGRRLQTIAFNIKGSEKALTLRKVQEAIASENLPEGVYTSVASLTQEAAADQRSLLVHALFAVLGIILLLSLVLPTASELLLALISAPLAIAGTMLVILLGGGVFSLGAMVGCIALFGVSLRNSVLLLSHYRHVVTHEQQPWNAHTLHQATAERLIPILMTALITGIGILPIALASGAPGREIEGPMATAMLGGLVTSTVLTLLILPQLALRFCHFPTQTKVPHGPEAQ